jgi:uncharacterized protein HemX
MERIVAEEIQEKAEPGSENKALGPVAKGVEGSLTKSTWLGVFNLFLIFSLVGIGFYLSELLRDDLKNLTDEVHKEDLQLIEISGQMTEYQKQLAAIQSQFATIQMQFSTMESDISNKDQVVNQALENFSGLNDEKLAANKKELSISIEQIKRQLGKTRGDWLIADAEYLLTVANQRLHLVGDVNAAIKALTAADQRLRESGSGSVFKVREEIAEEISLLKNVQVPDIVGIFSKLKLISKASQDLTIRLPYPGKEIAVELGSNIDADDDTNQWLSDLLGDLHGLVSIRRVEQPVRAIISHEDAHFIRQQLKLKIEVAMLSLLQHQDDLFKQDLEESKLWVNNNFEANEQSEQVILDIKELQNTPLHSDVPDVSKSLTMLRNISKLRVEADKAL